MRLLRDAGVRGIRWKDTLHLTRREIVYEMFITSPWIALEFVAWHLAQAAHWAFAAPALAAAFFFFLTGLRQTHNTFHYTLGGPRWAAELIMVALSGLMMSSMHAIQIAHLHHHKHCLDEEDYEGSAARMSAWRAICFGPVFAFRLHAESWHLARPRARRWILLEGGLALGMLVWALAGAPFAIQAHVFAMLLGQCMTGFFAVWTVHHDCDRDGVFARTQRGWLKNLVSYDMLYHLEHHLFPAVPTRHLPEIAKRLDAVRPDIREQQVY